LQIDDLTAELETASSKYLHLDAKNRVLQQELLSMKGWQRKCEQLEKENKKLEQEVVKLKTHIELNMVEHTQVEQYKLNLRLKKEQDRIS
jgi:cell shape-determining protein MreC